MADLRVFLLDQLNSSYEQGNGLDRAAAWGTISTVTTVTNVLSMVDLSQKRPCNVQ